MRKFSTAALVAASLVFATASIAAESEGTVVVELFTSQGCNSCPPADRVLAEIAGQDNVIALSLNVDYWDYLGWKDDLARPEFGQRHRSYVQQVNARHVYTPQMIMDGRMSVIGSRKTEVMSTVAAYTTMQDEVPVTVASTDTALLVNADAVTSSRPLSVWVVAFDRAVQRDVKRGENAGRALTYTNVVRDMTRAAVWDGTAPLALKIQRPSQGDGAAVIVQIGDTGPIVGAAKVHF